ncbi:SMI1 / KNR4 family [anaerobic digester metagenome]
MRERYNKIISILRKWENCGNRKTNNGTEIICNVPNVAPNAWLHKIYGKLDENSIKHIQSVLNTTLPNDFIEFISIANGINIFSDSLSVWGVKTSKARTGDEAIQPYGIIELNQEYKLPKNILIIGSYSWDGSIVLYDLNKSDKKIFRCHRDELTKLNEWNSICDWLECEVVRLSSLFDKNGYEYDEDTPTIPEC